MRLTRPEILILSGVDPVPKVDRELTAARRERGRYHPPLLTTIRPVLTRAVRVTGTECVLNCPHCGGHYLAAMRPLEELGGQADGDIKSLLVSGACNLRGQVPIMEELPTVQALAKRYRLNLHPGLVEDREVAAALGQVARVFSADFTGEERSLKSILLLREYGRVVPHICLGLSFTGLVQEREAVTGLVQAGFEEIVFIIFIPTRGTEYQDRKPPEPEEVAAFLAWVGQEYPQLVTTLGCMRPGGRYRELVDTYAVLAGVNAIVQPHPKAADEAVGLGLDLDPFWECCSLRGGHRGN